MVAITFWAMTMTDLPPIHPKAFPIYGKVPLNERLRWIVSAERHELTWSYRLDNGVKLSHEQVIDSITRNALFDFRQQVLMGRNGPRIVVHRKWSFRHGITFYRVADPRRNVPSQWISEDRMVDFTTYYQRLLAQDNQPVHEPPAGLDLQFYL